MLKLKLWIRNWLFREIEDFMALIDTFRTGLQTVEAQVAQLATDLNTRLAADAAALAEAQASAVVQSDVDQVTALGTQVAALDAVVNPVVVPEAPVEPTE